MIKDKHVIWIAYIDRRRTRKEGRRLPKSLCVDFPTIQELVRAAEKLGLEPEAVEDAAYPRSWWGRKGYVLVKKSVKKSEAMKAIAKKIVEMRKKGKK